MNPATPLMVTCIWHDGLVEIGEVRSGNAGHVIPPKDGSRNDIRKKIVDMSGPI